MANEPRTIKGPCFDECRNGIQEVRSTGFLDFYMECGCTYEGVTVSTPRIEPEETRPNVPQGRT